VLNLNLRYFSFLSRSSDGLSNRNSTSAALIALYVNFVTILIESERFEHNTPNYFPLGACTVLPGRSNMEVPNGNLNEVILLCFHTCTVPDLHSTDLPCVMLDFSVSKSLDFPSKVFLTHACKKFSASSEQCQNEVYTSKRESETYHPRGQMRSMSDPA
jgi:hypothetical protein